MQRLCGFNFGNWLSQAEFTPERVSFYTERDLKYMANLGFNFLRLPVDYFFFEVEPYKYDEARLCIIDRAIYWASKYDITVLLDMHHLPGYGVGRRDYSLWTDREKQRRAEAIWRYLTRRYREYGDELAFDVINEPDGVTNENLLSFYERMIAAIRDEDEDRIIYVEGNDFGRIPITVKEKRVVYSFHQYEPMWVTHLGASWAGEGIYHLGLMGAQPDYPGAPDLSEVAKLYPNDWILRYHKKYADKGYLESVMAAWFKLQEQGETVHCSEFGVYAKMAKRSTALNWYEDMLSLLKQRNVGWALWNLRGPFGVISTGREDWQTGRTPWGEPLDEGLLEILRKYL
ncbi:MAG: cellulase family glycosylhydrolase [TACK group archaeon]|nr:cellulase family glycosylhydrolase [TACK group archaeon]